MSELQMQAKRAREAWRVLAVAETEKKNAALCGMADCLIADQEEILAANRQDIAAAQEKGTSAAFIERLTLKAMRPALGDGPPAGGREAGRRGGGRAADRPERGLPAPGLRL